MVFFEIPACWQNGRLFRPRITKPELSGSVRIYVPLLERRAKLGCVSRGQNPASEALARHRVPSVASAKVTTSTKRTQGGDGPQCASVKGLSPVMYEQLWVPTCSTSGKATSRASIATTLANPPGSEPVARHHGRAGNSGDPLFSFHQEVGWHNL